MPSTAVICCCSKVSGTGVDGTGAVEELEVEGPAAAWPLGGDIVGAMGDGC